MNSKRHYHKLILDVRGYLKSEFITTSSLSARVNAEQLWGNYQLHESAFLGGQKNLRGFIRERFAGDALLYGGLELRSLILPIKIIFPSKLGLNAFVESGRIFFEGDTSNKWHTSYGGGLWISVLNRMFTLNGTAAKSEEDFQFYFTTGFMF
jgi:outer membrane translocation and assembly module TamA